MTGRYRFRAESDGTLVTVDLQVVAIQAETVAERCLRISNTLRVRPPTAVVTRKTTPTTKSTPT